MVDCLLPQTVRKLGSRIAYPVPRQAVKTSAVDWEIRGGEYVAYDRANYQTALAVWKEQAEAGDPKAQNYVGEIHERGLGRPADFAEARVWYEKAAAQGHAPAQLNLGQLYERGLGVAPDYGRALVWYRRASGLAATKLPYVAAPAEPRAAPLDARAEVDLAGPSIEILAPVMPAGERRGPEGVEATGMGVVLVGRVEASAGLAALSVNQMSVDLDQERMFSHPLDVPAAGLDVTVTAVDRRGRTSTRSLRIDGSGQPEAPEIAVPSRRGFGNYHALVIGNQNYAFMKSLKTPHADARAVAALLEKSYGFEVTLLLNATRYQLLTRMNALAASLDEDDNLLIYYAGHGKLDRVNRRGHWLPVDAEPANTANWISNQSLTDLLNVMRARHVMVVADSCYSGALTRSAVAWLEPGSADASDWHQTILARRARVALTSGGIEPVMDAGGGEHSVFARAFLEALRTNRDVLAGGRLWQRVSGAVSSAARAQHFDQRPEFAPIQFAGHEAGDFLFVPDRS